MSGSMMPITTDLDELFVATSNAGAKKMLLPAECQDKYEKLSSDLRNEIDVIFYSTPLDAARKALGGE
jgi:ATP-dependent Lon protease